MKSSYIVELHRIPGQSQFHVFREKVDELHVDTWNEDKYHVAPNKWTLGTCKAKCHILIMHELSGGKIGMRNTWHGDFHVSR